MVAIYGEAIGDALLAPVSIEMLRAQVFGQVLVAGDADYDEARKAWNLTVEQHPAVIVVVDDAHDVAAAVRYARAAGLGIAIQSTGHGVARPADDAMLIVTSRLTRVRVDASRQRAWVEAGAIWAMVVEHAQKVGLAPLLGSTSGVGVVGYTLGGGYGWLGRKYGLAADSVHAFELVTAEGELVRASKNENADLFWALKGGGGNFGVITGMEIQLYPVTTLFGGNLLYPAEMAREVFVHYRKWIAKAPDELTSSIVIMNFPPIPVFPEFLRGKSFVMIRGAYVGPVARGEALLKHWLDWKAPIANQWRAMPFNEVDTISNDPLDPSAGFTTGAWMHEITDEVIDLLIDRAISYNGSSPLMVAEIRHAGGAMTRVDPSSAAFTHRNAPHLIELIGMAPTPEAHQAGLAYARQLKRDLAPALTGGLYLNFVEPAEARARAEAGYTPEAFERLQSLKAKYDPDNIFQYSFNLARKSH